MEKEDEAEDCFMFVPLTPPRQVSVVAEHLPRSASRSRTRPRTSAHGQNERGNKRNRRRAKVSWSLKDTSSRQAHKKLETIVVGSSAETFYSRLSAVRIPTASQPHLGAFSQIPDDRPTNITVSLQTRLPMAPRVTTSTAWPGGLTWGQPHNFLSVPLPLAVSKIRADYKPHTIDPEVLYLGLHTHVTTTIKIFRIAPTI